MAKSLGTDFISYALNWLRARTRALILGNPLATSVHLEHRLPIILALPVFASDALSSVAYATQEILLQFRTSPNGPVSPIALSYLIGISIAIAILIAIVATSYRQAIHFYPSGGGSYTVARDNLGVFPGLIAASALVVDYILTVAVSVSSGVENLTGMQGLHALQGSVHFLGLIVPIPVLLAIVLILVIMVANLRGTKESGWLFALPAYSFVLMLVVMLGMALYRYFTHTEIAIDTAMAGAKAVTTVKAVGLIIILRAFSSGCSALTGVEAVSNGVSAFEPPEAKNASKTLLILMIVLLLLFMGLGLSVTHFGLLPSEGETVINLVARASFGFSKLGIFLSSMTAIATLLILMIAANTSFAGFPRLLAIVAKDGYAPKTFTNLGDRLVHTQGILVLTAMSILLVIVYHAKTNSLIPLYAVGVFICFTLSQLGMAKKVHELRQPGWLYTVGVNLFGALVTGVVAFIQAYSKFLEGAWMVILILPFLVAFSYLVHRHYAWFDKVMAIGPGDFNPLSEPAEPLTVLVLVSSDIHRGILEGLECGRAIADGKPNSELRAVHIEMDAEKTQRLKKKWADLVEPYLGRKIRLDIVPSPYRWLVEPIMEYLDRADLERSGDRVIIVLPEFETGSVLTQFLHNFTARRLRVALLNRPHVTVVSSRFFMKPMAWRLGRGGLVY